MRQTYTGPLVYLGDFFPIGREESDDDDDDDEFTPRNYQVELMKISMERNSIVYLPTGSEKTFVAVLVLKRLSADLNKPYSNGGKITIITVKSVALVRQHGQYVKDHTNFSVGCYTGELSSDSWPKETWEQEFNKNQVIILTAQILLDLINKYFLDLNKVNLLIFDESNRDVEEDPMRQNLLTEPHVLGLTATSLNINCKLKDLENKVKTLETTFHSKVATVEGLEEVLGYSTNPEEKFKFFSEYNLQSVDKIAIEELDKIIGNLKNIKLLEKYLEDDNERRLKSLSPKDGLRKLRNLIDDLKYHIQDLGTYGGALATAAHLIQLERIRRHFVNPQMHIIANYVSTVFSCVYGQLTSKMKQYDKVVQIYRFSSDKVVKLLDIIEEYPQCSNEELCAIIFTKRHFTAKVIHHILRSAITKFPHIKSNFMVDSNNNPYNTRGNLYISEKNKEVLDSFINKEINVLVGSKEEGIDLPKCTLVVKFDKCDEYRSYIQSKERAPQNTSMYYTLVEKELEPFYVNEPNSAQINMLS